MAHGSTMVLAVAALAFGAPFSAALAKSPADAPMAIVAAPVDAPPADAPAAALSLRPFVSNVLDRRHDDRMVDTGASGGGSYVEHVPQAAGLTFRAAL